MKRDFSQIGSKVLVLSATVYLMVHQRIQVLVFMGQFDSERVNT